MLRIPFVLVWNVLRGLLTVLQFGLWSVGRLFIRKESWVLVRVPSRLSLSAESSLLARLRQRGEQWFDWRKEVRRLKSDSKVSGVLFDVSKASLTFANGEQLGSLFRELEESAKKTAVWGHRYDMRHYALAARSQRILLSPPGTVDLLGFHVELFFLADLFALAGIEAQFVHIGRYKTAAHRFIKSDATPEQLENMQSLLDGLARVTGRVVQKQRGDDAGRSWLSHGPLSAAGAVSAGLLDDICYSDEVPRRLAGPPQPLAGTSAVTVDNPDDDGVSLHKLSNWSTRPTLKWTPLIRKKKQIAVVDFSGVIAMGDEGPLLGGSRGVKYRPYAKLLRKLASNRRVKAVVLAINSPGGSAVASDLLWRECLRVGARKPVIASMSDVAASGGYYLAAAAETVFACETTLTGSIGVVAGRIAVGGVLEQLRIRHRAVEHGEWAGFHDPMRPLDSRGMARLRAGAREVYRRFVDRVAFGREMSRDAVHAVGEGRVWLGAEAQHVGLVDEIGTLDDALNHAAKRAELKPGSWEVEVYPKPKQGLKALLGRGDGAMATHLLPSEIRLAIRTAHLLKEEPVLTLSPPGLAHLTGQSET